MGLEQIKTTTHGNSLMAQWLRIWAPNAGGLRLIPGQGTRSFMIQLKIPHVATKILWATTKTQNSQINK